jgi:hypothetical protein
MDEGIPTFTSTTTQACLGGCGRLNDEFDPVCDACSEKYGHHLAKAMCDPFDFAIGLKTGPVLHFIGKTIDLKGEWFHLPDPDKVYGLPFPFGRGMQVRLLDIAWVADAPNGS